MAFTVSSPAAVREFATANGFAVGKRGRFSHELVAAFNAANPAKRYRPGAYSKTITVEAKPSGGGRTVTRKVKVVDVRQAARDAGVKVSTRGRLPQSVLQAHVLGTLPDVAADYRPRDYSKTITVEAKPSGGGRTVTRKVKTADVRQAARDAGVKVSTYGRIPKSVLQAHVLGTLADMAADPAKRYHPRNYSRTATVEAKPSGGGRTVTRKVKVVDVRQAARDAGVKVSTRGRLPQSVLHAYVLGTLADMVESAQAE